MKRKKQNESLRDKRCKSDGKLREKTKNLLKKNYDIGVQLCCLKFSKQTRKVSPGETVKKTGKQIKLLSWRGVGEKGDGAVNSLIPAKEKRDHPTNYRQRGRKRE